MKIIIRITLSLIFLVLPNYGAFANSDSKSDIGTCFKIRELIKLDMQNQHPEHYPSEFKDHYIDYTNPNMDDIKEEDVDTYKNLDIDNDGKADVVQRSCSGSKNPETCLISVRPSSDSLNYENEFSAAYLTRYKSKIYVIEEAKYIYLITKNGFKEICKKYHRS